jgi:hypothetical protein
MNKAVLCGSCSDTVCQGRHFGDTCGVRNGQIYKCQPAYEICAPSDCECWTGPLP